MQDLTVFSAATDSLPVSKGHQCCDLAEVKTLQCSLLVIKFLIVQKCFVGTRSTSGQIIVAESQIHRMQNFYEKITEHLYFAIFFFCIGTAGNSLDYHRGMPFSTKDSDNDKYSGNCALSYTGAWWYNSCHFSNLNGMYLNGQNDPKGMDWRHWKNTHYSVKKSEMKIRPKDF